MCQHIAEAAAEERNLRHTIADQHGVTEDFRTDTEEKTKQLSTHIAALKQDIFNADSGTENENHTYFEPDCKTYMIL